MEKLFVPYELALELKSKGFDGYGFAWYNGGQLTTSFNDLFPKQKGEDVKEILKAPMYQQVIDWLREKHNIDIIDDLGFTQHPLHNNGKWKYEGYEFIIWKDKEILKDISASWFIDYHEGLEYAIKETLKLI